MIKNLFLSSIRSILKSKSTSVINVLALSLGIASCVIAYLHIKHELSFDKHHTNAENIYRVVVGDVPNGQGWVKVSTPIAPKLKAELPEVADYVRLTEFTYNQKVAVSYDDVVFNERFFYLADPSVYSIFDFTILKGKPTEAKNTVAISQSTAAKYFGAEDPIGKTIEVDSRMTFEVAAVFENWPSNSHFNPDFIISFENLEDAKPGTSLNGNWGQFNYFSYVLLDSQADPVLAELKIKEIVAEYGEGNSLKFENLALQSLSAIHFEQNRGNVKPAYDTKYLYIYAAIAFAILAISFINFINLNIASSTRRIKEVGVRKVMGASKQQLTSHFVLECVIITTLSSMFALLIVSQLLPLLNTLLDSNIVFQINDPFLILGIAGLISIIALFSGLYISLYILSFSPVTAVKGVFKIGNRGKRFKEVLLTAQFAISSILILASLFIYNQLSYLQNKDIGLAKEGVLSLQLFDKAAQDKAPLLIPELKKIVGVESASASSFTPGSVNWHQTVTWDGQQDEISWNLISIDKNFLDTYAIELIEGDQTTIYELADNQKYTYIVNEAALQQAGWNQGLGNVISAFGQKGKSAIAGVAKNFNYKSMHTEIEPVILYIADYATYSQVSIRYNATNPLELIRNVESTFSSILTSTPFEYAFAEDQFAELYKVEQQTSKLIGGLTIVAILLALTGVYALLTFTIKERTKEIAIRKVLGIQMNGTVLLLSRNYLKLLILGNVIGIPITWFAAQSWLQNFSYQVSLNPLFILLVPILTILLIMIVVGVKTRQVELINPVESLHYE